MYTRNYYSQDNISIPENYDGTALIDSGIEEPEKEHEEVLLHSELNTETEKASVIKDEKNDGGFWGFLKKLPIKIPSFDSIGGFRGFFSDFGTEEILILGIAAFLLFSGSHDIECLIMILLLLFIK